ncbi:MAG TPA: hypothetical protein VG675_22695 [Bryobacteraceae bacterium]|nr:hypothetical protein [Bryobacteraceae bacterium]
MPEYYQTWRPLLAALICATMAGVTVEAQVPAQDSRNTNIPNTDTHFKARVYRTLDEWQARRPQLRRQILAAAGLFPMFQKEDLHAQVFGKITNRDYTIEKVQLETLPGYYLGGNLYRPLKPAPAGGFPGIVSPHGHWSYGRLEATPTASVPARCISMARQGYVVFAYDMVGYDDTIQTPHDFGAEPEELWDFGPMGLQLWNSIRAVDFLQSLPDVNHSRIGAVGASGGATQTLMLQAVDDRIQFSAPVNMISAIMQGGSQCENAPNLRIGTFNVEIASMMAPKPMMMVSATGDWTRNTPREEYPAIRAIYALYGKPDEVETQQLDAPHNFNLQNREAVYRFFGKHVLGETDPALFKEKSIRLEKLQDMLVLSNRKLPDNALDYQGVRAEWIRMSKAQTDSITDHKTLKEMLAASLASEWPAKVVSQVDGEHIVLSRPDVGDRVPGIWIKGTGQAALVVDPQGAEAARKSSTIQQLIRAGRPVLLIDAFQTGSAVAPRDRSVRNFLTFNKTDDANRVQDILTALAFLNSPKAELVGLGKAGIWCQFAAALSDKPVELKADLNGFTGSDKDFLDQFFIPGIQRAGGLRTAQLLTR